MRLADALVIIAIIIIYYYYHHYYISITIIVVLTNHLTANWSTLTSVFVNLDEAAAVSFICR